MIKGTNMTEKLFRKDPYMREFAATVVKIEDKKVVLDRTCFYPRGGGQVGDTGYIGNTRVIDTEYENGEIVHMLESSPSFRENETVNCKIDWDRRYRIMRVHSASHIMEYLLFKVFGKLKLLGSHVTEKRDSSTYEHSGRLDPQKLSEVERLANEFISRNLEINTWPNKEDPDYWYWKCGEIEMPCGGTHPKNTSEIGKITIKRESGGSGKEKVITSLG